MQHDGGEPGARTVAAEPYHARGLDHSALDAVTLALLAAVGGLLLFRSKGADGGQPPTLQLLVASVAACLAWRLAAPASFQRYRVPVAAALRLAVALPSSHLLERLYQATLGENGRHADMGEPAAMLFFLFTLAFSSGAVGLALVSTGAARAVPLASRYCGTVSPPRGTCGAPKLPAVQPKVWVPPA